MPALITFLKTIAVMLLAAFGAGSVYSGMRSYYGDGFSIGLGVFFLLGAFFLYRTWFLRTK